MRLTATLSVWPDLTPVRIKLQDDAKLIDCGVQNGSTISLIMLPPFELYIQGIDQRMHTVVVPSSEPEVIIPRKLSALCSVMIVGKGENYF